jgi:hypothetical protein
MQQPDIQHVDPPPKKSAEVCDANMVMMGINPVGSEDNYPKLIYNTIDSEKLKSLLTSTESHVNKAPEYTSLPHIPQQATPASPHLLPPPPPLPQLTPQGIPQVNITSQIQNIPVDQEYPIIAQTENPHVVQITRITGQDILNAATTHILAQEIDPSILSTTVNAANLSPENLNIISTEGMMQNPQVNCEDNGADDESESIMNDIIETYSTETEIQEDMDIQNSTPTENIIDATPVVRVALMDFKFKPTMGEIYQVNHQGHLLKLSLIPGTLYQVDNKGLLQVIPLPIPLLQ